MGFNQNKLLGTLLLALAQFASATTWYVNGVTGSDSNNCKSATNACKTIGHAISLASSGDSIMVAAATYTENLTIAISLKVIGSGAATTIIDGGGSNTVITISGASANVTLAKMTIRNGFNTNGGGVTNSGIASINNAVITTNVAHSTTTFARGGGVYNNNGTLTINQSTVSHNSSDTDAGGVFNTGVMTINKSTITRNSTMGDGGGTWNLGTLKINDSTISFNTGGCCLFSTGGGIANSATMAINDSTVTGNTIIKHGVGGIENLQGTLTISNSTVSGNEGGVDVNLGSAMFQNSVVANNSGGNCFGVVTSNGYNLSSDNSCNFTNIGDLNNTDPKLGTLGNHGGPTQTIPLLSGSPAIDAGNPNGCTNDNGILLKTDQRGMPRPDREDTGGCDMGAYERQSD